MIAQSEKSTNDISRDLRVMSDTMLDHASNLYYYGGMNKKWASIAHRLAQVSADALVLANEINSADTHEA